MKRFSVWTLIFLSATFVFGQVVPGFGQTAEVESISGASGQSVRANVMSASWTWRAPATGLVAFDTRGTDFDILLSVSDGASFLPIASYLDLVNDTFSSELRFTAQQGQTYNITAIRIDGSFDSGTIVLNWHTPSATGDNGGGSSASADDFSSSVAIGDASGRSEGSNIGAGKEPGEPDHADSSGGASVWWTWTAPAAGPVTFDTEGTGFDTLLAVYAGDSLDSLTVVAWNDDTEGGHQSMVRFTAQQGQAYHVAVDGYDGATGAIVLNWQLSSTFITSEEASIRGPGGLTAVGREITWIAPPPDVNELNEGWNYRTNSNGEKDGLQIYVRDTDISVEHWVDGEIRSTASYRDGKPSGSFNSYADGELDGVQLEFSQRPETELTTGPQHQALDYSFETWHAGTPHGPFGSYVNETPEGTFGNYSNGELDGAQHTISDPVWKFENWRAGERHGPYGSFDRKGRKHGLIGTYTRGNKDEGESTFEHGEHRRGVTGNRPPEPVRTITDITLTRGVSTLIVMWPYFTDPDDDWPVADLTYHGESDDTQVARVRCGAVCTIRPVFGGTATITVTATDPFGLTAVQEFEVIVPMNRRPRPISGNVPEEITFDASTLDSLDVGFINRFFWDPDGDSLLYNYTTEPPGLLDNPSGFLYNGFGGDQIGVTRLSYSALPGDSGVATVTACDRGTFHAGNNQYIVHPERLCDSVDFSLRVQPEFTRTDPVDLSVEAPYCKDPLVYRHYPSLEVEICARDLMHEDGDKLTLTLSAQGNELLGKPFLDLDFDPLRKSWSCKAIAVQGRVVELEYELEPGSDYRDWWGWDTDEPLCRIGQSPDCFVGPELWRHPGNEVNRGELAVRSRIDSDMGEWQSKGSPFLPTMEGRIQIKAVGLEPEDCETPISVDEDGDTNAVFRFTDSCDDGQAIHYRLFQNDSSGSPWTDQWPRNRSQYYVTQPFGIQGFKRVPCPVGKRICYGAKPADGRAIHWGVGLDGTQGCQACCWNCPDSDEVDIPRRLACPGPPPPGTLQQFNITIPSDCPRQVSLCVRDHGREDGDKILVTLNGSTVHNGLIKNNPTCYTVPVDQGANPLTVQALNEGSVSPNTGTVKVSGGNTQSQEYVMDQRERQATSIAVIMGAPSNGSCPQ